MRIAAPVLLSAFSLLGALVFPACGARTLLSDDGVTMPPGTGGALGTTSTISSTGGSGGARSTTSSNSGTGGVGPSCLSQGDPCTECLVMGCSAVYCQCYDNLTCAALFACLRTCAPGDMACSQACYTEDKDGISTLALMGDCASSVCAAACPGFTPLTACEQCLFTKRETEMNACLANEACAALIKCNGGCAGEAACEQACATQYPAGVTGAYVVGHCSEVLCPGLCP